MHVDANSLAGHSKAASTICGGEDRVLLTISGNQLTLQAAAGGRSVTGTMAVADHDGDDIVVAVNADQLAAAAAQLGDEASVAVDGDTGRLVLESGWSRHELPVFAADTVDTIGTIEFDDEAVGAHVRLDATGAKAVYSLKDVLDDQHQRVHLRGALLDVRDDRVVAVGTDGQRLEHIHLRRAGRQGVGKVLLDRTTLQLAKEMADDGGHVRIELGPKTEQGRNVRLVNDSRTVVTPTIAGKPLEYERLLPDESEASLTVSSTKDRFSAAVTGVTSVVGEASTIELLTEDGGLTVRNSVTDGFGLSRHRLGGDDGSTVQGTGELKVAGKYLARAVKGLPAGAETASLQLFPRTRKGDLRPMRVHGRDDNVEVTAIVMPRRS